MKKLLLSLIALILLPIPAHASIESFQVLSFSWNPTLKKIQFRGMGSGTAIGKNLVLTNKHVITTPDGDAALVILCQSPQKSNRSVNCDIPASVISTHSVHDAALLKPLDPDIFLPHVGIAPNQKNRHDRIRIEGFPIPLTQLQNFGNTETYNQLKTWSSKGGPLKIGGDKLTITRGYITNLARLTSTNALYYATNAKVNFGNSGGAAFDNAGNFIGIPSLKDQNSNAFILAHSELAEWIKENRNNIAKVDPEVQAFYETQIEKKISTPQNTSQKTTSRRYRSYRYNRRRTTNRRTNSPSSSQRKSYRRSRNRRRTPSYARKISSTKKSASKRTSRRTSPYYFRRR